MVQENNDMIPDDEKCGKRIKTECVSECETNHSLQTNPNLNGDNLSLPGLPAADGDGVSGPVQQLVAMFGALVAQGDKAIGPLEIIFSSISVDLLAEVVMANMRHLPPTRPKDEREDEPILGMGSVSCFVSSSVPVMQSSFSSDVPSLWSAFPLIASLLNVQPSAFQDASVRLSICFAQNFFWGILCDD